MCEKSVQRLGWPGPDFIKEVDAGLWFKPCENKGNHSFISL